MIKAKIFADGASRGNPGPAGIGAVIELGSGIHTLSEYIGTATNNVAEYRALIAALKKAVELNADDIVINVDSELLARQIEGRYRVKNPGLIPLFEEVMRLLKLFKCYTIYHIPRENNREADLLAKNASLKKRVVRSR